MEQTKKRVFYGWFILVIGCMIMFVNYGLANGPMGLYLISTTESLGITRAEFSLLYTFRSITMMTFNMFLGTISQKLGLRRMIFMGCCSVVLALVIFSVAPSGIFLYIGGLFLGLGFATSSTGALSTLCKNWFYAHRGLATGIVLAASGFGSSLGSTLVSSWIEKYSWRISFRISAAIILAVAIAGVIIIRNTPEDKGLNPFGSVNDIKKTREKNNQGVSFRQAIRHPDFYIIMASMICIGMLTNPLYTNVSPQIIDQGLGQDLAAHVISLFFIILAVSKIVLGQCYDSFGFRKALCLCFSANIAGIVILLFAKSPVWYYVFGVVFAISVPLETVMVPFLVSTVFGDKHSATFMGIALALNSVGVGIGNPIMSAFYDANGTYRQGQMVFLGLSIVVFTLLLIFTSKRFALVNRMLRSNPNQL